MEYKGPFTYDLFLSFRDKKALLERKEQDGQVCNFQKPVTEDGFPKLYIIRTTERDIAYVGYTVQSINARLYYGFNASGKSGYHGYKWVKELTKAQLLVFVFNKRLTGNKDLDHDDIAFVEAIEAELVYLIRTNTSAWPIFQNEIHFNNIRLQEASQIAEDIYRQIFTL
jgi:hypothetical protein